MIACALGLGQLVEGVLDQLGADQLPRLDLDVVGRVDVLAVVALLTTAAGLFRPHPLDRPAVGLAVEERAQLPPGGVEPLGLVPEAQEHLLHDLFGAIGVDEHPPGQAVDRGAVAVVELLERPLVRAADGGHQARVVEILQLGFHVRPVRHGGRCG